MVVGEFTQEADVLVIGGGPAGYSAAFRAAELGANVAIVDNRPSLGGICLHEGCIPSKALLGVAATIADAERAAAFGVVYSKPTIDVSALRTRCTEAIATLGRGLDARAKALGIERLTGAAHFENSKHIAIHGGSVPRVKFRKAIIATGIVPIEHPFLPFEPNRVLSSRDVMRLLATTANPLPFPKTMKVVGSGYQAVEVAMIAAAFGIRTSLIAESEQLLPEADADLTRPVERRLKAVLREVRLGATIETNEFSNDECVVVAVGERANTAELRLDFTQVKLNDAGFIAVDASMRTSDSRIFAVGDVTGAPLLADKAMAQGHVAGEVVVGWNSAFDARAVPFTVFTDPQLAWCGLTEREAKQQNIDVNVIKVPWGASGRAVGLGRSDGLTKIILDPATKLILGVGITGVNACELIAEACLAIEMGAVATDLAATVHPHPSLSELLAAAAQQVDDTDQGERT